MKNKILKTVTKSWCERKKTDEFETTKHTAGSGQTTCGNEKVLLDPNPKRVHRIENEIVKKVLLIRTNQ